MRALSLTRPWPYAILKLGKRLENRSHKRGMPPMCKYRGPLLLHAAKSWDDEAIEWIRARNLAFKGIASAEHPAGGIVGRCNVVGHIEPRVTPNGTTQPVYWTTDPSLRDGTQSASCDLGGLDTRWWMGGYALVLADVEPVKWVPCKGALGLWTVPDDVLAALGLGEDGANAADAGATA